MSKQERQTLIADENYQDALHAAIDDIIGAESANNTRYGDLKAAMRGLVGRVDFSAVGEDGCNAGLRDLQTLLGVEFGRLKFTKNPDEQAREAKPYVSNEDLTEAYRRAYKSVRTVLDEAGFNCKFKANDADHRNVGMVKVEITPAADKTTNGKNSKKGSAGASAADANKEGAADPTNDHEPNGEPVETGIETYTSPDKMLSAIRETLGDEGKAYLVAALAGDLDTKTLKRMRKAIDATLAERKRSADRQADIEAAEAQAEAEAENGIANAEVADAMHAAGIV